MAEPISALFVPLPDADLPLRVWHRAHDPSGRLGVPAHVTILAPFVAPDGIDDEVLDALRDLFGTFPAFDLALSRTARFFDTLYLAPEPEEPFRAMTHALIRRWPERPPYGGSFPDPTPHVTVAHNCSEEVFAQVDAEVEAVLPIETRVHVVRLIAGSNDIGWDELAEFALET